MTEEEKQQIMIINEDNIKNLIYEIRGQKVMLDFDLARIYGYETSQLNRQVKRNNDKFPEDFMFQLSEDELGYLVKCQNGISRNPLFFSGNKGGTRKLPYAFTEQGVYMLMTVLRGNLAIEQSKALIRLFKQMKDYIVETQPFAFNTNSYIESRFASYDKRFEAIEGKLNVVMDNFIDPSTYKHFLILNDFMIDKRIDIKVVSSKGIFHDRYIILDYNTDKEVIYHSGASSKDVGDKISTIMVVENPEDYHRVIDKIIN